MMIRKMTGKKRTVMLVCSLLLCCSLLLAACGSQTGAAGETAGKTGEAVENTEEETEEAEENTEEKTEEAEENTEEKTGEDTENPEEKTEEVVENTEEKTEEAADTTEEGSEDASGDAGETAESAAADGTEAAGEKDTDEMPHAVITVEDYGTITIALDSEAAPTTVDNFMYLAREGFYDGLTFHRIIDGFMIQGGDPKGNGTGGSDITIVGEFASNGYENPISHVKGVISMARAQDPNSASSQFFITVADSTFLDGEYAAFGYVTDGMDVAEKIAKDAKPIDSNGTMLPDDQPVITSIVIEN